jgi:hypothetical protein
MLHRQQTATAISRMHQSVGTGRRLVTSFILRRRSLAHRMLMYSPLFGSTPREIGLCARLLWRRSAFVVAEGRLAGKVVACINSPASTGLHAHFTLNGSIEIRPPHLAL